MVILELLEELTAKLFSTVALLFYIPTNNYKNKRGNDYFLMERPSRSLEKAMAPHSRTLAWKIPWKAEPGMLQSMGSLRVGHD